MPFRAALTALVATFLLTPAAAQAQCQGAPGVGAVEQYCESIPDGSGGRTQQTQSGSGSYTDSGAVPNAAARELDGSADGQAVLGIAGSGGSDGGNASGNDGKGSGGKSEKAEGGSASTVSGPEEPKRGVLAATTNAVSSGPSAGSGLVWGLVAITVLGAAGAVWSRRRGATD